MSREVRWISDPTELADLAAPWDALAQADPTPFSLHAWYSAWWDGYGAGRELAVCTVWDGSELAGVFPLCRRDARLEAMANQESCVVRPLARDTEALRLLADAAARERYGVMEIRRLPEGDEGIAALAAAARAAGRFEHRGARHHLTDRRYDRDARRVPAGDAREVAQEPAPPAPQDRCATTTPR